MTLEYPWYSIVEGEELEQGDFIDDCDVLVPDYSLTASDEKTLLTDKPIYQVKGIVDTYDLVVVSQSCDLENGKLEYVLMCPRWSYKEYGEVNSDFKKLDKLEQLRQGKYYRYCMLNENKLVDLPCEIQIVDLGTVFSVPYITLKQMAKLSGKRLRLLSPYKEKLAQDFAYYYMRIALPNSIQKFERIKEMAPVSNKPTDRKPLDR